jgi:hypothetical protein
LIINAGIVQGQTGLSIDSIVREAEEGLKEIARIPCGQINIQKETGQ